MAAIPGPPAERPLRLVPNPVARFYRDGGLLHRLRGEAGGDGHHPEDWLGSCVEARGTGLAAGTGLGSVELGEDAPATRVQGLIAADPEAWLGADHVAAFGTSPAVLAKLLDAGERLPLHVHPTRAFARRHLGSRFGKTESWLVLTVADGASQAPVWVGFQEGATREQLRDRIAAQSSPSLLQLTHELQVAPGDVVLVPGGTPHAIGAGILVIEPQEPTDFSVLAEHRPFGVDAEDATLGLGWERALDVFTLEGVGREVAEARHLRRQVFAHPGAADEVDCLAGFGAAAGPFFGAHWARVRSPSVIAQSGMWTGIVTGGTGTVAGRSGVLALRRGDAFVVPAAANPVELRGGMAPLELVRVLPPVPGAPMEGER